MSAISVERMPAFVDEPPQLERRLPPERRGRVRTQVHWPVWFLPDEAEDRMQTLTQNLSSGGFYCLADRLFTVGETFICLLKVPSHDPNGNHIERILECRTRVMRVETQGERRYGIACRIEDYHFAIVSETRSAASGG